MIKLFITDVDGAEHALEAETGVSLMEIARNEGISGIAADCGGACSCATCHVFVAPEWMDRVGAPDDIEFAMLDMVADVANERSRLSCQIKLSEQLDGLKVAVAPSAGF